jgi:transcriptional regulator with XRE-family HTH domain
MELVERIKALCQARGITLNQMEKAVGLKGTVARWVDHDPSIGKVRLVAQYFGMTVSELIEDDWSRIDMSDAWDDDEDQKPASSEADGLEKKLTALSPELRAQFVRFLALAKADPERAARFLAFVNQELSARK